MKKVDHKKQVLQQGFYDLYRLNIGTPYEGSSFNHVAFGGQKVWVQQQEV